jgi:mono/diheme cytochrome c family protein
MPATRRRASNARVRIIAGAARRRAMGTRISASMSFVAAAALLAWSGTAAAQSDTVDTGPGKALAQGWCAECHDVTGAYSELMGARNYGDPPSFYAVANDHAITETALRAFLRTPHARMPNIMLDESQTAAIVDYILSLRR